MSDLRGLSDDQLMALYQQTKAQRASGFVAGPSTAPDVVGRRQEYNTAQQKLAADAESYRSRAPLMSQLDTFENDNKRMGTGGFVEQLPLGLNQAMARMKGGDMADMASLGSSLQVNSVPKGQGQISNFERELFAAGTPNINQQGPVNQRIIQRMRQAYQNEGNRLNFMQAFLQKNGHLNGADGLWTQYQAQGGGKSWKQYFGLEGGGPAPSPRQAANAQIQQRSASRGVRVDINGRPIQ